MALDMVPITGRVPMPDDTAFVSGQLILELSGPDAEGNAAIAPARVIIDLDGADIPAGFEVFRNDAGVMNTTYKASVAAVLDIGNGLTVRRELPLGSFQIGAAASYTLGELLSSPVPDGNSVNLSILTPAEARVFMELGDMALRDTVATSDVDAGAITNAKLADMAANTIKGAATAGAPQDLTPSAARAVLQISDFANRADLVAWAAANTPAVYHTRSAAGELYVYLGTAGIADMTGWHPAGDIHPDHWGQNVTPATTSMSVPTAAADAYCAVNGGVLRFRAKVYRFDSPQVKDESTFWLGEKTNAASGGVGTTLQAAYNGRIWTITGTNTNYQGGVEGMRWIGDRTLYPDAVMFYCEGVNDHQWNYIYAGNMKHGILAKNCKTFNGIGFYGFGMLESSVRLFGDTQGQNTDHCWLESQFAGDIYGIEAENCGALQIRGCRPQVSGVANGRFHNVSKLTIADGFCDSAKIVDGADGYIISNCTRVIIAGNQFYSNGTGSADIWVVADDAQCADLIIDGNQFDLGTSGTRTAISFVAPVGTGSIRNANIRGNNFRGMTTAIAGPENVATELRAVGNDGIPEYVGRSRTATDTTAETFPYHGKRLRLTGTLNADFDVNIPNARAFVGDELILIRENAGTGTITLKGPNGAAVGTLTGPGQLLAYCMTASATQSSTTYKV